MECFAEIRDNLSVMRGVNEAQALEKLAPENRIIERVPSHVPPPGFPLGGAAPRPKHQKQIFRCYERTSADELDVR
jgi:hypothetical protein